VAWIVYETVGGKLNGVFASEPDSSTYGSDETALELGEKDEAQLIKVGANAQDDWIYTAGDTEGARFSQAAGDTSTATSLPTLLADTAADGRYILTKTTDATTGVSISLTPIVKKVLLAETCIARTSESDSSIPDAFKVAAATTSGNLTLDSGSTINDFETIVFEFRFGRWGNSAWTESVTCVPLYKGTADWSSTSPLPTTFSLDIAGAEDSSSSTAVNVRGTVDIDADGSWGTRIAAGHNNTEAVLLSVLGYTL